MSDEQKRTCVECGREFVYEPKRGRPPVTCSPDCQHRRRARKVEESRDRHAARKCPPDKHGTSTGYTLYKCDCAKCRRWARDDQRARRDAARSETGAATRRSTGASAAKRRRGRRTK